MSIIENLKLKKEVKKIRLSVKIDEDLKSDLSKICDENEIKIDDFVNEVLRQSYQKEVKKNKKSEVWNG